jgi:cytochrome c biogenesis protein CcmG/thiol:disulfide interchange protein DsbE
MLRIVLFSATLIALAALLALFAINIDRDPQFVPSALLNKPAPDITLRPIEGPNEAPGFGPQDLKGQVVLVNVFASWCVPCRQEHPLLMELAQQGVTIYGINEKDAADNARKFLAELGDPYTRIGADPSGRAAIEWGVYGVPESFVVNAKGIITYKHVGPLTDLAIKEGLLPALTAAAQSAQ